MPNEEGKLKDMVWGGWIGVGDHEILLA
ncbi:uncharacterized protein G2W53_009461 [Senna tora]|uniref:Uncharacterized protein n=1 Tax=Senna tora TaxID=362788 RepID=A0A835CCL1_9FABA|nr:uncharacterized protein G2W53_009461 [Senna tora]